MRNSWDSSFGIPILVSRYIHRNPIEMKTPFVDVLEAYPWSSYSAFINEDKAPVWLNRDAVYGELGSSHRYKAYKTYVNQGNDENTDAFYQLKNKPAIWGDKIFKDRARDQAQSLDDEVDKKGLREPLELAGIIKRVADYFNVSVDALCTARRGKGAKNIPRWMAMKLCQEQGGAKLSVLAECFNVTHYSTISQTIGRLNRLLSGDKQVELVFNMLSQDLTP